MHRTFISLCFFVISFALSTFNAEAFVRRYTPEGQPVRIDFNYTPTVSYHLGTSGSIRGVLSNELNAVRIAFDQWQKVPGTVIRFNEGAQVSSVASIPEVDGRIDVLWVAPGNYPAPALGGNISIGASQVAVAWMVDDGTGVILQCIILINRNLDYVTEFDQRSGDRPFVESVLLHEIGHVLGLNHSPIGASTMWWYQRGGVGPAAGLSPDEIAFAKSAYGTNPTRATLGTIRGTVRRNGTAILGAVVSAEAADGRLIATTVSRANGGYELPGLEPGTYHLRINPLDTGTNSDQFLVRGVELDVSSTREFDNAVTDFLPSTTSTPVQLAGNSSPTVNLTVNSGAPPFRITEMRISFDQGIRANADGPLQLLPGETNRWIGVYIPSSSLPAPTDVSMNITGGGWSSEGSPIVLPNALRQLTLIQMPISIDMNAIPGMRSISVTANGFTAWANGFLDFETRTPDYNFDGLDDVFQRRYFRPYTRSEAGPNMDPDADGYVNRREAQFGTDPTNPADAPFIISTFNVVNHTATIVWETVQGRRYQLWYQPHLGSSEWTALTTATQASGEQMQHTHPAPGSLPRGFYQVRQVP